MMRSPTAPTDLPLNLVSENHTSNKASVTRPRRVITGAWMFQGAAETRDGTFQASQELTSGGYTWRLKLSKKSTLEELRHLEDGLLYRSGPGQPGSFSGTRPTGSGIQGYEHRELMTVLNNELEAQYGQSAGMYVRFQETQSLPLRLQRRFQSPWLHRIWRRLAGAFPHDSLNELVTSRQVV